MKQNPDGSVTLSREEYRAKRDELNRALKKISELEQMLDLVSEDVQVDEKENDNG